MAIPLFFWAERHPLAKRASELLGGRAVRYPRSTLVSLFEFGVGAGANLGVVVHLGGNDLGQLKGMELILWRLAWFAVGVARHSAALGIERVQGCVSSGQGQEEGKLCSLWWH